MLRGADAEEDTEDRIFELVAAANAMVTEASVLELKKGHEPWCRISNVLHLVWKC